MDRTYDYPLVTGTLFNALQKISIALNVSISSIYISQNDAYTSVTFIDKELTESELVVLNAIMTNDPCGRPDNSAGTTIQIPDIWKMRDTVLTKFSSSATMWLEDIDNSDGSTSSYIYLHFDELSSEQLESALNTCKDLVTQI